MICVFGATGQVGLLLVRQLSKGGHPVRALAHGKKGAATLQLPGVEADRQITERESIALLLRAGVSDWMMEGIKDLYRMYDRNDINPLSDVTQRLTGRAPRSFSDFLDDYTHLFSRSFRARLLLGA